ncbi:ABC transporter permease [Tenuibacillus multivorans]|uniref:ABC-2 type transport system permease protein n=1 Tax=Tenuibacillus multivorans TaxID=237069 RepID=A0A1H0AM19_9BACI|nr:ABC transporter permease [Tenuibacillus multivorans]GEL78198.1 exporter of polyketide antibiotics [Tenuibacillus multivorans]SDN34411.1 ABC-2 type transport system permease protein [Tenuibacillus multivorans]
MGSQLFLQIGKLSRLILRRDRVRILAWIFSFVLISLITVVAFDDLYSSQDERQEIAATMENPAITALIGKGYGLDHYTVGAMMAHQMLAMTLLIVGIMSILLVVRHTRSDEEEGRVELIRSLPTGRLANIGATLWMMTLTNIALALITGVGLYALGIESMDLNGSLLYGAALGVTGIFFAAVTALCAQLTETSKGVIGLSFLILGVSYLVRAVGDVTNETLSWFSPFGWVLESQVYVNDYWWPIVMTLVVAIVIAGVALYLNAIRDLGAGFIPTKGGKRHASRFSQHHIGLTLRLQKTSIISWAVVLFIFGATYGSVLGDTEAYFAEIELMKEVMQQPGVGSMTLQFVTMIAAIMAIFSTIPVMMSVFKVKKEEKQNRIEHVLATAISRPKFLGHYLLVALITSLIMFVSGALGLSIAGANVIEESVSFSDLFNAIIVYLPASWVLLGLALVFVGLGRFNGLAWLYLGFTFVIIYFGGILKFPDWVKNLSPYEHITSVPIDDFSIVSTFVITLVAIGLMVLGLYFYRRRDIKG